MDSPRRALRIGLLFAVAAWLHPSAAQSGATGLKARYSQGQTFITWKEADAAASYRVRRHSSRITAANVASAETIATLGPDSGAYRHEARQKILQKKTGKPGYGQRYIITDDGEPLAKGVGLCVVTVRANGNGYYAVETLFGDARPASLTAVQDAVNEKKATPGAVRVLKNENSFVYTHWMDPRDWNPKYQKGYAYNFTVTTTRDYDGKPAPVVFRLHGMSGDYQIPDQSSRWWQGINVHPGDKAGSWFFGFLDPTGKSAVNYTERRLLLIAAWLKAGYPNQPFKVDAERIYVSGGSMGGTGTHALTARHGDVFAAGLASKGAVNHKRNGKWTRQFSRLIGPVEKNTPTRDGPGVWDWQNYGWWHENHIGAETGFISHANGTIDESIPWGQMHDYYASLQKAKRPFMARWKRVRHSGGYFGSTKNVGLNRFRIRLHESLPAFANASNSDDSRKTPQGQINEKLEWSASLNDFAPDDAKNDIVDEPGRYAICIRAIGGPATVDVTPRRCQKFRPKPGEVVSWEVFDHSKPAAPRSVASGELAADKYGLVTVRRVAVPSEGWGARLVLNRKQRVWP